MMNRIDQLFRERPGKILAVYFTAGFPQLDDTLPILEALEAAAVDLVEIGMPFSDPLADGPVIQQSSAQALKNGMTIDRLFEQLTTLRSRVQKPVVLMGYLNPVLQYGMQRFLDRCHSCGIDGVILPDMPPELYDEEYAALFDQSGIYPVFLVTPRTPQERVRAIAHRSRGFLYAVSSAGTTGSTAGFSEEQLEAISRIAAPDLGIPVLTGFGIHDAETFEAATRSTRGGIVGSAFIKCLQREPSPVKAVQLLMQQLERDRSR